MLIRAFAPGSLLICLLILVGTLPAAAKPRPSPSPRPSPVDLSGTWSGEYAYGEGGGTPVAFILLLQCKDGVCRGSSTEKNTFEEPPKTAELHADWEGGISRNLVALKKTYDGKGGYSHSVRYTGKLTAGERPTIQGAWKIDEGTGPFSMRKD